MKKLFFLLLIPFGCLQVFSQNHEETRLKKVLYDNYGRVIQNENGEKIKFSYTETRELEKKRNQSFENSQKYSNQNFKTTEVNSCDPNWEFAVMGTCIGRRSLNTVDIDSDGVDEIICSAQPSSFYGGYWGYWYILKYNGNTQKYDQNWVSDAYNSSIRKITAADIDNDNVKELLVGFSNGKVLVYNSNTLQIINQFTIPSGNEINDIQVGDADNDGNTEIVIADEYKLYLYSTSFSVKSQINYGCFDFKIGNVDNDEHLEIVTSRGKVIAYNGSEVNVKWMFESGDVYDQGYMVELSDIDNDGMKEIVRAKVWYYIDVFDADLKSSKYQIEADVDIHALLLYDTNNDGVDEIIYGDAQWGALHCFDASTQLELWSVNNPDHGVTGIAISDVDNDGTSEIMWGAGWTSTGADYFYVASTDLATIEWKSVAIDGPFYAIEVDDIDNDGVDEIVTISYESASGYDSGIITIFDSQTHEQEWQCDGDFLYMVWTGIYDFEIYDIDGDGVKEIIVAAGQTYTGKIWIIDGITKEIQSSYTFNNEDISEFCAISISDIDNDQSVELIVSTGSKVYILNPVDFSIKWSLQYEYGAYAVPFMLTGNVDEDENEEIVVCKGNIYIIDGVTHMQQWKGPNNYYSAFDLYDYNNDGNLDIIAGTNNGEVEIFDGTNSQPVTTLNLVDEKIDGIRVSDLNGDQVPEIIFTSNGVAYFYANGKVTQQTQNIGELAGKYNGLKLYDINGNGKKEILIGSSLKVVEISSSCYDCIWFSFEYEIENASCGIEDGSVVLDVSNGVEPYSYSWSTNSQESAIFNLPAGSYEVEISDALGCELAGTFTVLQSVLTTYPASTNATCNVPADGTASVTIIEGTPPYTYVWSTGETSPILSGLEKGTYTVTVTDSKNCTSSETIQVEKDTLIFSVTTNDIACFGDNSGNASTFIYEGNPPYSYQWSMGGTSSSVYGLAPGNYSVAITDNSNCSQEKTFTITEPDEILTQVTTTPDDPTTAFGEGTASINVIGGVPPYSIKWDDPYMQTGVTAINLSAGTYFVAVEDNNLCQKIDTAVISYTTLAETQVLPEIKLYPNPAIDFLNVEMALAGKNDAVIQIFNIVGELVYSQRKSFNSEIRETINISDLNTGYYSIAIIIGNNAYTSYFEVVK